jgi:hypothetical protein
MNALVAYARERLPLPVFAPALALLAGLAWAASGARLEALPWCVAVVSLLVVQFRLWDDLEDVDHDRLSRPSRVLTRAPLRPFRVALALSMALAGAVFAGSERTLAAYAVLCLAMLAAYRAARRRVTDRSWRYGLLLLKYPVFVALAVSASGGADVLSVVAAAAIAYAAAAGYEAWHTQKGAAS